MLVMKLIVDEEVIGVVAEVMLSEGHWRHTRGVRKSKEHKF